MTKMKSKKMTKSTFAIVIMAIVMVAILAFGGTYAYFTANAVGESVGDIKTAQLELLNMGEKLTYTSTNEIVPGDYVFGKGLLAGTPEGVPDDGWTKVPLDLGNTNAAVYAFVKVDVRAMGEGGKTLMVKYGTGENDYAPVLNLIPRLNTPVQSGKTDNECWTKFDTITDPDDPAYIGTSSSTYIFYFAIEDTDEQRERFEFVSFEFALQFDSRVHADRTQNTQGEVGTTETTNVYEQTVDPDTGVATYGSEDVPIMGVDIEFSIDFRLIQQTGFKDADDAYRAAFAEFGKGSYTDTDTIITPPVPPT